MNSVKERSARMPSLFLDTPGRRSETVVSGPEHPSAGFQCRGNRGQLDESLVVRLLRTSKSRILSTTTCSRHTAMGTSSTLPMTPIRMAGNLLCVKIPYPYTASVFENREKMVLLNFMLLRYFPYQTAACKLASQANPGTFLCSKTA